MGADDVTLHRRTTATELSCVASREAFTSGHTDHEARSHVAAKPPGERRERTGPVDRGTVARSAA